MREIKFRVFDKDTNTMYMQDDLIINFDGIGEDVYINKDDNVTPMFAYELMQYTGLKDKNGIEIYEGDIVECFRTELATVKFISGCFVLDSISYTETFYDLCGEMKVIGNIYEIQGYWRG